MNCKTLKLAGIDEDRVASIQEVSRHVVDFLLSPSEQGVESDMEVFPDAADVDVEMIPACSKNQILSSISRVGTRTRTTTKREFPDVAESRRMRNGSGLLIPAVKQREQLREVPVKIYRSRR
jgi:hypothetical protein